jgi:hypothetical protein
MAEFNLVKTIHELRRSVLRLPNEGKKAWEARTAAMARELKQAHLARLEAEQVGRQECRFESYRAWEARREEELRASIRPVQNRSVHDELRSQSQTKLLRNKERYTR